MELLKPYNNKDDQKALTWIKQVTDENVLFHVVINGRNANTRLAAIDKISNQDILTDIVLTANLFHLRQRVYKKITRQDLLYKLVIQRDIEDIQLYAIKHIESESALFELWRVDYSKRVKETILLKITSQTYIKQLLTLETKTYTHWGEDYILKILLAKITNQETIFHFILSNPYPTYQQLAIARLTNQDYLLQIINQQENTQISLAALKHITSNELLYDIALKTSTPEILTVCLRKMVIDDDAYYTIATILKDAVNAKAFLAFILTKPSINLHKIAEVTKSRYLKDELAAILKLGEQIK